MGEINPGTADEPSTLEVFDRIEDALKFGGEGDSRVDLFKSMFEAQFEQKIENIDEIEIHIDNDQDLEIYDYCMERFIELFDNYFGIVADRSFQNVDLDLMYNMYIAFSNKFIYYMAKYCYGSLLKKYETPDGVKAYIESVHKNPSFETEADALIYPFTEDENNFEFEDFLDAILITNPGDDFIITLKNLIVRTVINVDNIAIRRRISMEVLKGENETAVLNLLHTYIDSATTKGEIE